MSTIAKVWQVAPPAPPEYVRQAQHGHSQRIEPLLIQLMYNRSVENPSDFLFATSSDQLMSRINPSCMKDVSKAAQRICHAIRSKERILVYGDFDCDGVTSTTLLMQVLKMLAARAEAYIPDRVDEGYGLNSPALLLAKERGYGLVVTVDCGIRSVKEVNDANDVGLDVIVTDHHSVGSEIPAAYAVINPQQEDCGGHEIYSHLAGVGVAFMLAMELVTCMTPPKSFRISDLLDLVAIGTVADVMHLNDPLNRLLVVHGLKVINEGRRLGLKILLETASLKLGAISSQRIGFGIGPRINAAGRLDKALKAYRLLSADDANEARKIANELEGLNRERQRLTRDAQERIKETVERENSINTPLIFAQDSDVLPGIVGLVAGRLTEEFYRPTVVLEYGATESRASCRSIPEFHITHALDSCADLLLRHGGHAMAAGFTVANENLAELKRRLMKAASEQLSDRDLLPTVVIDAEMPMRSLSLKFAETLSMLEPTGHQNPPARFMTKNMRVVDYRPLSNGAHLKLKLSEGHHPAMDAIAFGFGHLAQNMYGNVDAVYALEVNEYNGRRNAQLVIQELRQALDT